MDGDDRTADLPVGDLVPATVRPRRRRWPLAAAAVVAMVAVVGGGLAWSASTGRWPARSPEWHPAVEPLARFVETARGGTFEEPVEVVFNSRADYSDHFAIDRDSLDEESEEEVARSLGELRALGFIAGDLDLFETAETLGASGTLGFFDPEDGRIHVRGDESDLDTAMRVTLVHELTHAYDFGHFDLEVDEDALENSGEEFGYRAVVEGSASLVEAEYVESLTDAEQEEAYPDEDGVGGSQTTDDAAALEGVPPVFLEAIGLPYAMGPRFLMALAERTGASSPRKAVDEALRRWPATEEQVVDLEAYDADEPPRKVAAPALRPGEEETGEADDFGQLSLALLLAPHVGADAAWESVQGWSGDATRPYRRGSDGPYCLRVAVAFDGAAQSTAFRSAAQKWAAALSAASATVSTDEDLVVLDACDPGAEGPPVPEAGPLSVSEVVVAEVDLVAALVDLGVPRDAAECLRTAVFDRISVERYLELDARLGEDGGDAEAQREVQDVFAAAGASCGLQPQGG